MEKVLSILLAGKGTTGIFLESLALGYLVLYLARKEEKFVRALGYLIGIGTILLSALNIFGKIIAKLALLMH